MSTKGSGWSITRESASRTVRPAGGRRCPTAPDIWEIIKFLHEFDERGPAALDAAAEVFALDVNRITTAIGYYGDYREEIEAEIEAAEEVSKRAEQAWYVQRELIG